MKGKIAILFGAVVYLTLLTGCSTDTHHVREYDPALEARYRAEEEASREYLVENFSTLEKNLPTREQALQVRECVTARTGYEYEDELSADSGPPSLTGTPKPVRPIEEDMPFRLVERALVAVGQRKPLGERVNTAEVDCVYELGLEDMYFPPSIRKVFRPSNS